MFSEKVNQVFDLLEVTSADFARIAECDKSHISRMANGARVPKNGGAGARRLVNGIYLCADERGKTDGLCALIGCKNKSTADGIKTHLMGWLYDGEEVTPEKAVQTKEKTPYRAFGERLSALMELTGLSNIRLGRALSLDPSYISRFRSGFRSPKANPKIMKDICFLLIERAEDQDKISSLSKLIGTSTEELSDREKSFDLLYEWLYNTERTDSTPFVEGLIDQIGSFSADIKKPPLTFEEAADKDILSEDASTYYGIEGLRRAVIRFLGNVIMRRERELFLYSDQNMDWMVSDPVFRAKWASLMALCVSGGTRIHIIHNVNRDLSEMSDAIKSWLPLYPSGMIKSYYCKTRPGNRFSTTLFLCPGYACIFGSNAIGTESENGMYRFDTDPIQLEAHEAAYNELIYHSGELAGGHQTESVGRLGESDVTESSVLCHTLSLATMPEKTLLSALSRAGADEETKKRVSNIQKEYLTVLRRNVKSGFLHEYVPLPSDEELFGGAVPMDIPGITLTYTPQEYAEHIRNIIAFSDKYANYRFYAIPEVAFEDVKILVSDRAVAVARLKAPYSTILFEHPDLCRAFAAYVEHIREQYRQDKLTTKHTLERYL